MKRVQIIASMILVPMAISVAALEVLKQTSAIACSSVNAKSELPERIQCAQEKAERQTPEDLADAIYLIGTIPDTDPQHEQGNRLIRQWEKDLTAIAEEAYQTGDLEKATRILEMMPAIAPNAQSLKTQVATWKKQWAEAEEVEKSIKTSIDKGRWADAFEFLSKLRSHPSAFWAEERRTALAEQIQSDRELRDSNLKNPVDPALKKQREQGLDRSKFAEVKRPPKAVARNQPTVVVGSEDSPPKPAVIEKQESRPVESRQLPSSPQADPTPPLLAPQPPTPVEPLAVPVMNENSPKADPIPSEKSACTDDATC
jgi:hypothetical protein